MSPLFYSINSLIFMNLQQVYIVEILHPCHTKIFYTLLTTSSEFVSWCDRGTISGRTCLYQRLCVA